MSRVPELPAEIPRRGGALTAAIGKAMLATRGWRIEGNLPAVSKMVLIVAPHTSAWDLAIALATEMALRLEVSFLVKHTLFSWPLGVVLRAFGGIPVDRRARHDIVEQMTRCFDDNEAMILAISPEGTRRQVDQWKTGFYHIARNAGVPIVPTAIDFAQKTVRFGPPLVPAGDQDQEILELRAFFDQVVGKCPDLA